MTEVLRKVVDALEDLSRRCDVEIIVDWDTIQRLPLLQVDEELCFEALLNLVHNAVKYSVPMRQRMSQVIINADLDSTRASVSVGNRGIAIKDEEKDLIFKRYYRTRSAQRYRPDGTGIGLTLVKAFVDHYDGTVEVTSTQIPGTFDFLTRFVLRLPIRSISRGET